jgi:hypothetical protein
LPLVFDSNKHEAAIIHFETVSLIGIYTVDIIKLMWDIVHKFIKIATSLKSGNILYKTHITNLQETVNDGPWKLSYDIGF